MNLNDAIEEALLAADSPVVTDYGFYLLGARLFQAGSFNGVEIKRMPSAWGRVQMRNSQRRLMGRYVIAPDSDFSKGVWRVVQSSRGGSAEEITAIIDPFCYISHLSAMQRYGLTERSPEALHLSTPWRPIWAKLRDQRMAEDGAEDFEPDAPMLTHHAFKGAIRRRSVIVHETRNPASPIQIGGEPTRITTIGRTFVDMLDNPQLCGGARHVVQIWEKHAEFWINEITESVDEFRSPIVKVRAGYILNELLGLESEIILSWRKYAQRGGSRKLDPEKPYASKFSEPWMISINV